MPFGATTRPAACPTLTAALLIRLLRRLPLLLLPAAWGAATPLRRSYCSFLTLFLPCAMADFTHCFPTLLAHEASYFFQQAVRLRADATRQKFLGSWLRRTQAAYMA